MGGKQSRNSSMTVLHGSRSIVSNSRLSVYAFANPADTKFSRENVLRLTEQHAGVVTGGEIVYLQYCCPNESDCSYTSLLMED